MTLPEDRWERAAQAASLVAVDPALIGGAVVKAGPGPVRDAWCERVRSLVREGTPVRRMPIHVTEDRLLGGLDLVATLRSGKAVLQRGVLAEADEGVVFVAMAERLAASNAAHLCAVLDRHEVLLERDGLGRRTPSRFGVVALDEGIDDQRVPHALHDRLALIVDLEGIAAGPWIREAPETDPEERAWLDEARALLPEVEVPEPVIQALCSAADTLGVPSLRAPLLAMQVARVAAALQGRTVAEAEDASVAAAFVLGPRATRAPAPPETEPEEPEAPEDPPPPEPPRNEDEPPPEDAEQPPPPDPEVLEDVVLAAAQSAMPEGLLLGLQVQRQARSAAGAQGTAGALQKSNQRGRPVGVRPGNPRQDGRLNVVETLRSAAPWQRLRADAEAQKGGHLPEDGSDHRDRVRVRPEDFRITKTQRRTETLTIFAVDASGSAAAYRLAEAKGAVEQVLADCYVRRDNVALIAFRRDRADLILPPTKSLVRAKRSLVRLPGGGATPLAAGLDAARALADDARRRGQSPVVVVMTDGKANVARDGSRGGSKPQEDALAAARALREDGVASLFVDTAVRPRPEAKSLAEAMAAQYLALPYVRNQGIASYVSAAAE